MTTETKEAAKSEENLNIVDLEDPNLNLEEPDAEIKAEDNSPTSNQEAQDTGSKDKFEGKDRGDILDSYKNLEREFHGTRQVLAEQQRQVDSLQQQLRKQSTGVQSVEPQDGRVTFDDVVADAEGAINSTVAKSLEDVYKKVDSIEKRNMEQQFVDKHPDYQEVGQSQEFVDWASKSAYRQNLYNKALQFDLEAADIILSEFKLSSTPTNSSSGNPEALKVAATGGTGKSLGTDAKPLLSRKQILSLRANDPDRYEKHKAAIELAYKEDRIVD